MAEPAPSSSEQWTGKLDASRKRYFQRVEKIKDEIREDDSLSDIERAVLGVTGSPYELQRYQGLAADIGKLAGKPIVVIPLIDGEPSGGVRGGIIAGAVEAKFFDEHAPRIASELRVPVTNGFEWYSDAGDCRDTRGFVRIAQFSSGGTGYAEETKGYHNMIMPEGVLLDRRAINRSPYFNREVNVMTQIVDQCLAQAEIERTA
jgi:hypothetical protein